MWPFIVEFFVEQVLEVSATLLVKAINDVLSKSKEFKPRLEQLKSTVDRLTPIFEDIRRLNQAGHRPETESKVLADQLIKAESLVRKCDGVHWWNKSSYAKKLIEYDRSLTRFFQIDVAAQILHGVRRVEENLAGEKKKKEEEKKEEEEDDDFGVLQAGVLGVGFEDPFDRLRNSPQFLALIPLLKENRNILKLTLQGLWEKHPHILELIKDHKAEFLQLIYGRVDDDDIPKLIEDHKDLFEGLTNEPVDGSDGDLSDQPEQEMPPAINVSHAEQEMPHTISVILAEQEAIDRLEEMGFDSDLVIEAFLACDGNEELAVNYLLENAGYFED